MARELQIIVTAETQSAVSSLNKTEDAIKGVTAAAGKADDALRVMDKASETAGKSTTGLSNSQEALTLAIGRFVSVAAIGAAIDRTIDFADNITDLAAKTGLSAEAVQRFGLVAEMSGSSMEQFASSVMILNKNLASDTPKVNEAIKSLGLSMSDLMSMSIDERTEAITDALGGLADKGQQTELAMILMGRAGKDLTATFEELRNGAAETVPVLGDDARDALARLKDEMTLLTTGGTVLLAESFGGLVSRVYENIDALQFYRLLVVGVTDDMKEIAKAAEEMLPDISAQLMPPGLADVAVTDFNKVSAALDKQRAEAQKAAQAAERLAEAQRKAFEASIVWGSGIDAAINYTQTLTREIDALHMRSEKKLSDILDFEKLPYDKAVEDLTKFLGSVTYFSKEGSKAWATYARTVEQVAPTQAKTFEGLSQSFQSLPLTILGALQGGGNVLQSIGSSLGGGLGADLGKMIAQGIGGKLGSALGSLGGPMGSALGAAAGKLAGQLFGKVFGPSQQKQVMEMRNKFFEANGGLEALQQRANLAGVSVNALFNVRTVQEFDQAVKQFNKDLAESEAAAAKAKEELAKMNTELGDLLKEAADLGVVLPDSMQDAINKLLETGQITDENRALFEALGMGSQSQFKAMEDAAKKYGVELSALGPAFNQNKLNERAADIIQAFTTMTKGGADVAGVIAGMSDEINQFVQDAIRTGATVPENMRPILEAMIKQGQLTDANGQKLTDLGSINFGAPIQTATDRLIAKIQELIDKIAGNLPNAFEKASRASEDFAERATDAINSIPDEVRVRFLADGSNPDLGFDRGGIVGRDFRAASSRDVIPALLRPGEVVLTPEQAANRPGAMGAPINVSITVAGYLDSASARQQLASIVSTELGRELRQRRRVA